LLLAVIFVYFSASITSMNEIRGATYDVYIYIDSQGIDSSGNVAFSNEGSFLLSHNNIMGYHQYIVGLYLAYMPYEVIADPDVIHGSIEYDFDHWTWIGSISNVATPNSPDTTFTASPNPPPPSIAGTLTAVYVSHTLIVTQTTYIGSVTTAVKTQVVTEQTTTYTVTTSFATIPVTTTTWTTSEITTSAAVTTVSTVSVVEVTTTVTVAPSVTLLLTVPPSAARSQIIHMQLTVFNPLSATLDSQAAITILGPSNYIYFDVFQLNVPASTSYTAYYDWTPPNQAGSYTVSVGLLPPQPAAFDTATISVI
jgi:hypothetical protein